MKDFNYYLDSIEEIGSVEKITNSIVYISGLPGAKPEELVLFEDEKLGQVVSLARDLVEVLIFSKYPPKLGTRVVRTNEALKVPADFSLLGNVIDPLGNFLESLKATISLNARQINTTPSGILTRRTITKQLETGVAIVDLVLPLGHGQRELVIGDRKTGKTAFLLQAVVTQAKKRNICIYALIGKKKVDIKALKEFFASYGILKQIIIVASSSESPTGIIYLTPYTAMTIAEYFRDEGKDVLLVLDDLSSHAKFYREISLLAKRFPGRNSYPGDIFYTHARLLERAGNFVTPKGERSITCLPVVETIQGDLSGYIQTNLMSMTDGHLYFDSDLFAKGRRPAVNPFLSVTRVGRQIQSGVERAINREILTMLSLYEKMQSFAHFGAEVNESTKITLAVGEGIIKFFEQHPSATIPINVQIFLFGILWNITMRKVPTSRHYDIEKIIEVYETNSEIRKRIDTMIDMATSFNNLLGAINQEKDKILKIIDTSYDN